MLKIVHREKIEWKNHKVDYAIKLAEKSIISLESVERDIWNIRNKDSSIKMKIILWVLIASSKYWKKMVERNYFTK